MTPHERDSIENHALLRASGERPPDEFASEAEATTLANFMNDELPAATRAPRDFAAAAIAKAMPQRKVVAFPRLWQMAAAAVVTISSALTIHHFRQPVTPPITRFTAAISNRIDAVESELRSAHLRLARGRYHRQPGT